MPAIRDGIKKLTAKLDSYFPRKFGRWIVGVVGIIILSLVGDFTYETIQEWIRQTSGYRIAVVGIDMDRTWEEIKEGVKQYKQDNQVLDDLKIQVRLINHEGNFIEAEEKAQQLMADGRVIAVVLVGTSSQVERLLEHYRGEKPVLLARSTNPYLDLSDNMFRLPPNDKRQVEALTQFAKLHWSQPGIPTTKIVIFRDHTNENYARYIADNVRDKLDQLNLSMGADEDGNMKIQIVADGEIAAHNEGIHISSDFVGHIKPDVVFYAGNGHRLLPLIHQAANFGGWLPVLVLTDGSVNSEFLQLAQGKFQEAFATFPVFPEEERYSKSRPDRPSGWSDSPSYKPYGYDALAVLLDAIRETDPRKVIDEKTKVPTAGRLVEGLKRIDYPGLAGNYSFKNGENTEGRFHVYHAVRDGPANSWRWEHSSRDCPLTP